MIILSVVSVFFLASAFGFDPKQHINWRLLPHNKCGSVWRSRIIGGHEAPMNAYPWLAQIGHANKNSKKIFYHCGGVLVTSKVVLTAGHCIYFPSGKMEVYYLKLFGFALFSSLTELNDSRVIRLGEHDTKTNPDCNDDYCADPVVDIAPSEIIVPKIFNYDAFQHDIALIRLKDEVKFTSFVKPICMKGFPRKDFLGSITEVAGWGIHDLRHNNGSDKLQVIQKTVVKIEECEKHYGHSVKIGPEQICAGGELGKDSCGGDSGGPLMKVGAGPNGPRYFLLGIVSFGAKKCGKFTIPGVYTKMSSHMEWFLNNLEKTGYDSIKIQ